MWWWRLGCCYRSTRSTALTGRWRPCAGLDTGRAHATAIDAAAYTDAAAHTDDACTHPAFGPSGPHCARPQTTGISCAGDPVSCASPTGTRAGAPGTAAFSCTAAPTVTAGRLLARAADEHG